MIYEDYRHETKTKSGSQHWLHSHVEEETHWQYTRLLNDKLDPSRFDTKSFPCIDCTCLMVYVNFVLYFTHLQLSLQCCREEAVTAWQLAAHQDNSSTRPMWTRESKTEIKMVKNYWAGISWYYYKDEELLVDRHFHMVTLGIMLHFVMILWWLVVIPAGLHLSVDCRRDCSAAVTGELLGLAQLWHFGDTAALTKRAVTQGNVNIDGVRMNSDMCHHHHSDPPPSYQHQQLPHYDNTQVMTDSTSNGSDWIMDHMIYSSGVWGGFSYCQLHQQPRVRGWTQQQHREHHHHVDRWPECQHWRDTQPGALQTRQLQPAAEHRPYITTAAA